MTFNEWLDEVPGRTALVARQFGVTISAVTQWRSNGVPLGRMKAVQVLSGGRVGLEDMVPESPGIDVSAPAALKADHAAA